MRAPNVRIVSDIQARKPRGTVGKYAPPCFFKGQLDIAQAENLVQVLLGKPSGVFGADAYVAAPRAPNSNRETNRRD